MKLKKSLLVISLLLMVGCQESGNSSDQSGTDAPTTYDTNGTPNPNDTANGLDTTNSDSTSDGIDTSNNDTGNGTTPIDTTPVDTTPVDTTPVDECNTTAECQAIYGQSATDCVDSKSNQSYCQCGANRCAPTGVDTGVDSDVDTGVDTGVDTATGPVDTDIPPAGTVSGELRMWHKITISFVGPNTSESATPNPFTDYRLNVTFTNGNKTYVVPGYYAADGNAANTSADAGNIWMVHFAPDATGTWTYTASFRSGSNVAISDSATAGQSAGYMDGKGGSFNVLPTNKTGRDMRAHGRLDYVGAHYLQFAGTGEYFVKQGSDAPENLLAYEDFDGDFKSDGHKDNYIKSWSPHVQDWKNGDPTFGNAKGKGLIGAVNYMASEGLNAMSFLTMNINGDDQNVFPYTTYDERYRMDVSRLAQWEVIFEHMDHQGIFLHFKTQETENDHLLDGGELGNQRKLYYRELIARFSHHLAINWNLGEENTQTTAQQKAMAAYFHTHDPYQHLVVLHTYPGDKNSVYTPLLGSASKLTGLSMQMSQSSFSDVHSQVVEWVTKSTDAGKPWVVSVDEPGDASAALRPDSDPGNSHTDGRKNGIWGTFMGGGAGNEWYFGYKYENSDLTCEDFRSRDAFWDYARYALEFFNNNNIPVEQMINDDAISSASNDYVFYDDGNVYVVYLKDGGSTNLDLGSASGIFTVKWYDPRNGGALQNGSVTTVTGGGNRSLGNPPNNASSDWVILVRK